MWKTIYDKLVSEISQSCIDWDRVELLIKELGTKINERYDDGDSLLSFLYPYVRSGKAALELTERFLSNGYDVSANAGFNGSACLHRLCRSFYDHYILPVAQRLLEAGADSSLNIYGDKEEEGVLDSIGSKSGYWVFGYFDSANIFEAYYKMVQRKEEGKPYKGIRAFRDSVGQKIILNPYFDEGDALIEDLSEAYSDIIGSRIRSLRFES